MYRVATNYLLDVKKSCVEREQLTFEQFAIDLSTGLSAEGPRDTESSILTEEVKLGCTLAMLQCLDRPHRLAYVLGEIFDLPAPEAAAALQLEPAAFRKRLQRARQAIETFTRAHCGLVSDSAACQCNRRVPAALQLGRASAGKPVFADSGTSFAQIRAVVRRVERAAQSLELHRTTQPRGPRVDFVQRIMSALP